MNVSGIRFMGVLAFPVASFIAGLSYPSYDHSHVDELGTPVHRITIRLPRRWKGSISQRRTCVRDVHGERGANSSVPSYGAWYENGSAKSHAGNGLG